MQWNEFRVHVRHLTLRDLPRVMEAFKLGEKKHEGQKRKSGEPYFTHPVAVAHMLADMGADAETIIAALLHDTIEDTDLTSEDINARFGSSVRMLIEGVTKLSQDDMKGKPSLDEQIETLRKMFTLMERDVRIMVIKLVDRLHNMQTVQYLPEGRQRALAKETQEVYVRIADRLCMQDLRDELESLCLAILEPEIYPQLSALRLQNETLSIQILSSMESRLQQSFAQELGGTTFQTETKTWERLKELLAAEGTRVTGLTTTTIVGICPTVDECYRVLGLFHQLWKRENMSFQDFINTPAVNGYRGLHTTVILEDGTRVRCKLRTPDMHRYARSGVSIYCFHLGEEGKAPLLWTQHITSLATGTAGQSNEFWESLQKDILGESIVIYGPGDQSVLVPKTATVLDGAFYLFGSEALFLKSASVGGKEARLDAPLENASSINVTMSDKPEVRREWLDWTNTGVATAAIRAALSDSKSTKEKIDFGREELQKVMTQRGRGYIEELKQDSIADVMRREGYESMNDVFIAIAEGRIDALKVYGTLFSASSSKTKESKTGQETLILKYSVPVDDPQTEERLSAILARAQGKILSRKSTLFSKTKEVRTRVSVRMTPEEQRPLLMALEHSGARDLRLYLDRKRWSVLGVLLLLWGLDSVFAKLLIDAGVSPAAMTLIRTWTCFAAALATVIFQKARRAPTSQISLGDPTLWIAGICFFALAHITHLTLVDASPFLYKTALRGSVLVTTIPLLLRFQKRTASFTAASVMALLGLATIAYLSGTSVTILAVSTAIAFAAYTLASERFQSRERIDMRYPQFFLAISFISAVASLFLMLTSTFMLPSLLLFALAVGFTLIFVCLPYALFFILSHDIDYGSMAPFFHGSIFITFFAQWALLGLNDMFLVPGALFLIAAALIGTQTSSHITHRSMAKRYATNA